MTIEDEIAMIRIVVYHDVPCRTLFDLPVGVGMLRSVNFALLGARGSTVMASHDLGGNLTDRYGRDFVRLSLPGPNADTQLRVSIILYLVPAGNEQEVDRTGQ